jgi:putative ABC transport system permease protein
MLLSKEEQEEKLGDLEEVYLAISKEKGLAKARLWYRFQVLRAMPACLENFFYWRKEMFKSYLKTTMRNLAKNKITSFINIFGLSIGITFAILVFLFVKNEYSFDRFHPRHKNIYRILNESTEGDTKEIGAFTPMRLAEDFKNLYPEIERVIRICNTRAIVRSHQSSFREQLFFLEKGFFKVFVLPILKGNRSTPLNDMHSIVITKKAAQKYFGEENPIGKLLNVTFYKMQQDFRVTAVIDNRSSQSSLVFDLAIPFEFYKSRYGGKFMMTNYNASGGETYILLKKDVDPKAFNKKLAQFGSHVNLGQRKGQTRKFFLQPLKEIHFNGAQYYTLTEVSAPIYSYILSGLGFMILIIGCINFLTLALGRSARRSREVGIRKVAGATKKQLMKQYLGEAIIISSLAMVLGILFSLALLPTFNQLAGKQITFSFDLAFVLASVAITLFVGLAAGSYPAVVLSRFSPVKVLKGLAGFGGKEKFSKVLVVVQFALSSFLIVSTLVMKQQLNFMLSKDLGFHRERLVEISMNSDEKSAQQIFSRFKNEVKSHNKIIDVSAAATPYGTFWSYVGVKNEAGEEVAFFFNQVDYQYLSTMGIKLLEGRNFSESFSSDPQTALLVNETLVNKLGLKNRIGETMPGKFANNPKIIGVFKDFNFASLHKNIQPLALALHHKTVKAAGRYSSLNTPGWPPFLNTIVVRIDKGNPKETMAFLESKWREISPGSPVNIYFVEDTLNRHYFLEKKWGKIVNYASAFAIFVAALGLFGLTMIMVEKRIKEFGIRKVLGAATGNLVLYFSKELLLLVAIGNLFSWPFSYFIMRKWLQNFAFKTGIDPLIYLVAMIMAMVVAGLTIAYQTYKTASVNPVETIRYE